MVITGPACRRWKQGGANRLPPFADNAVMSYSYIKIEQALKLLDGRLSLNQGGHFSLVVCGGAALNAMR